MNFENYKNFDDSDNVEVKSSEAVPLLDERALYTDTTEDYVIPSDPRPYSKVIIRFRTAKDNIEHVFLVDRDGKELMEKVSSDDMFDYYEKECKIGTERYSYFFKIVSENLTCYYDKRGVSRNINPQYSFFVVPGFSSPEWAKGAVIYQIYVDRFYNGDKKNDVLTDEYSYIGEHVNRVEDWNKMPASMGVREFYGGDLQGVLDKMDYIQGLGVDAIYFNPLFVSPSNHKYDIQDYDYIDPHFGRIVYDEGDLLGPGQQENRLASRYINRVTNKANLEASNQLFIKVVEEAHRRGMKIILDGVFNHCGSFNKWLDRERIYELQNGYEKGAYVSESSPYKNFFDFKQNAWPYNGSYDGWWGHDTLPKLNYEGSKVLYDYILKIAAKWVAPPFNADGWRLDVAADLGHSPEANHEFWRDFREVVKDANPNAIILAEHYGSPEAWLCGDEWDTVMNYDAFMEPLTWFFTGMEKHSDDRREDLFGNADSFINNMSHHSSCFTYQSWYSAMNELSNHDHSRFLTRTNHKVGRTNTMGPRAAEENVNKAVLREAVVMQMTWPGAPTIYYGDEAGLCGFTDPDNRRTYPWGNEDKELIEFHRQMISIHKKNPEIMKGSIKCLDCDYNVLAYGRFNRNEQTVVAFNNNFNESEREIQVTQLGIPKNAQMIRLMLTDENGFDTTPVTFPVVDGILKIKLPRTSAVVLKYVKKEEGNSVKKFLHFT